MCMRKSEIVHVPVYVWRVYVFIVVVQVLKISKTYRTVKSDEIYYAPVVH